MTLMCGEKWLETGNPFAEGDMSESKEAWLIAENERLTKENEQQAVRVTEEHAPGCLVGQHITPLVACRADHRL